MNKGFWGILAAAAVLFTVAAPVPAQSLRVTATIPFGFTVGKATLPAGEYSILPLSNSRLIQVSNQVQRSSVLAIANSTYAGTARLAGAPRLVFNRYGDHYVLSQIWDGTSTGHQFPMSRSERTMAQVTPVERLEIVAMLMSR
ncbi:MAG: hypothetical protein ACE141_12345 [Bryobacteraceae bacterium]